MNDRFFTTAADLTAAVSADRDRIEAQLRREIEERSRCLREAEDEYAALQRKMATEAADAAERARQERAERLRDVSSWDEAFRNGIALIRAEAGREAGDNAAIQGNSDYEPSDYFARWLAEVEMAAAIYREEMAAAKKAVLNRVADRLAAGYGEDETVNALRNDEPSFLVDW